MKHRNSTLWFGHGPRLQEKAGEHGSDEGTSEGSTQVELTDEQVRQIADAVNAGEDTNDVVEKALAGVRAEIAELQKPQRENPQQAEQAEPMSRETLQSAVRSGIELRSEVRYQALPGLFDTHPTLKARAREVRSPELDALYSEFFRHTAQGRLEQATRARLEADALLLSRNPNARAVMAEGAADSGGGIAAGTGADLVPVGMAAQVDMVASTGRVLRPLSTRHMTEGQQIRIPVSPGVTAATVAEGGTPADTSPDMATQLLDKKKFVALVSATEEMVADTAYNLVNFLSQEAGTGLVAAEEGNFGGNITGGAADVSGALDTSVTNTFALATAATIAWADFTTAMYDVTKENRRNGVWLCDSGAMPFISQVEDGAGGPLFRSLGELPQAVSDIVPGAIGIVFGRPIYEVDCATAVLIFGDPRHMHVLEGGPLTVKSWNTDLTDVVNWKFTERLDFAVARGGTAFTKSNAAITDAG